MQLNFDEEIIKRISFLTGDESRIKRISALPALEPFCETVIGFFGDLSQVLMKNPESRQYSDIVSFGFWIRKASVNALKERFTYDDNSFRLGRGVAFHIAPSNVPVNFAYSLAAGLLTGNINIVRVPSKDFVQIGMIASAINETLKNYPELSDYITLVRYSRDKEVNDLLSSISDTRIIWGGDETIAELRKSPIPPRSNEITFADRFSLAVIDSDEYCELEDKGALSGDFYNDTYFSDQNACTSPTLVVWTGSKKERAKEEFWNNLWELVSAKYAFQDIQGVNKLTGIYNALDHIPGSKLVKSKDNLITRVLLNTVDDGIMDYRVGSGFFFEYDCDDIMKLRSICDNKRCQTVGILGKNEMLSPLLKSGIKGIDRIVPIGRTMDFDLVWDGYNLPALLTRTIMR